MFKREREKIIMTLITKKWRTSTDDFEQRKEKAIQLIKNVEFVSTPKIKFKFSEQELRTEFVFDDADKLYDKFDNFYFDGNYVIYPKDKIIYV